MYTQARNRFALAFVTIALAACSSSTSPPTPRDGGGDADGGSPDAADTGGDGGDVFLCPGAGETQCGDDCVDTDNDPAHCGDCDNACADGEVCSSSICKASCTEGLTGCGGACIDTASNIEHC